MGEKLTDFGEEMKELLTDFGEEMKELIKKGVEEAFEKAMEAVRQSLSEWDLESKPKAAKMMGMQLSHPNEDKGEDSDKGEERTHSKETYSVSKLLTKAAALQVFDEKSKRVFVQKAPLSISKGTNPFICPPNLYWNALKTQCCRVIVFKLHENEYGKFDSNFYDKFKNRINATQVFDLSSAEVVGDLSYRVKYYSIKVKELTGDQTLTRQQLEEGSFSRRNHKIVYVAPMKALVAEVVHTLDYAGHFLSCCSGLLGLEYKSKRGYIGLDYYGRNVNIKILLVGIHMGQIESVKPWWIGAYWVSPLSYGQNAISVNEFTAKRWMEKPAVGTTTLGSFILRAHSMPNDKNWKAQTIIPLDAEAENSAATDGYEEELGMLGTDISRTPWSGSQTTYPNNNKKKGMIIPFQPLTMTFHDVDYYVDMPKEMQSKGIPEKRLQLLSKVSGVFLPVVLTALVGSSGEGKTTLMDLLAGRKTDGYIEGDIRISGHPKDQRNFARVSGYVEQNDIHSPQVTVFESLWFSANLRLPKEMTKEKGLEFVEEVMCLGERDSLRNALVGLPGSSGLSTEQRKRLTIVVELVSKSIGCSPSLSGAIRVNPWNVESVSDALRSAISRLGGSSAFIGKVGEDEFGYMLADILKDNKVDNSGMRFDPAATTLAFVTLRLYGEREFMFFRNPIADMLQRESELDLNLIKKETILHYGSISLIEEPADAAREGIMSIWDQADVSNVNMDEISFLTGGDDPYDDNVVLKNLYHSNLKLLLVTEGSEGCRYYTKEFKGRVSCLKVKAVDTTGAGDAFVGGILNILASDENLYKAMVRKLSACMTIGFATTICTDITGTLKTDKMKVTKFWLGKELVEDKSVFIASSTLNYLHQGAGLNTITGSIYLPSLGFESKFSGSLTEKAIHSWAVRELPMDVKDLKKSFELLHVEAFNSEKKRSGILLKIKEGNTLCVHWKGAAKYIMALCSNYYDSAGNVHALDDSEREKFDRLVEGLIGIKNPCQARMRKAIQDCQLARINVKMITGDKVFIPKVIATACRILKINQDMDSNEEYSGAVVEGLEFRNYAVEERMARIEIISVMARSSPFDKLLMVQTLKQKEHIVAVTGDVANNAPALNEANIGLFMGIAGTKVAKESSDIVILDDSFATVVDFDEDADVARKVFNTVSYTGAFIESSILLKAFQLWVPFPAFDLEDKVVLWERGNVMDWPQVKWAIKS